jgi:hypothetical protein
MKNEKDIARILMTTLKMHRSLYGKVGYPILDLNDSDRYFSSMKFTPLKFEDILDENEDDNSRVIEITSYEYKNILIKDQQIKTEHKKDDPILKIILIKLLCDIALKAEEIMEAKSELKL